MALKDGLITVDSAVDIHLDDDEMVSVTDSLGIDELPGVLDWRPPYGNDGERRLAVERELRNRGALDHSGLVTPALAQCIRVLARSIWDLEVRTITRTPTGPAVERRCLSAGVDGRVIADRTPTGYWIRTDDGTPVVNSAAPLRFSGVSAPRDSMAAALDRPRASTWAALGCDETTAMVLGEALSVCAVHVEIVLIGHRGAVPERIGTPIALFQTARGRVLATTSFASDGTAWTSLAPGTDSRVRSEIQTLISRF